MMKKNQNNIENVYPKKKGCKKYNLWHWFWFDFCFCYALLSALGMPQSKIINNKKNNLCKLKVLHFNLFNSIFFLFNN